MIGRHRVGKRLQDHRLTGSWRRDDEAALAFPDRRDEIENARGHVRRLELDPCLWIKGREVVEEDLLAGNVRMLEVDRFDFDEGEIALAFFRWANLSGNRVTGPEI